ncbi:unnamed protein product [Meganyctiphanes norvegica]|uniref:CRAL-TRIO domain-containing protein n=1 Tax=Meganyctiphanes norvegica TaxID=48144 RepID=A0AAV2RN62_MEGNR
MSDLLSLQKLLEQHITNITTMSTDDAMLNRYLVASSSVQEAYERILATDKWRKNFPVADVNIDSKGVRKIVSFKTAVLCDEKDIDGRPVIYVAVKNHSMKDRCLEEYTNYIIYMLELSLSKCSKDMENICILWDMKGFSLAVMDFSLTKKVYEILQTYYPERMGIALILNAPFIFQACWSVIRPWLHENTANKIKFVTDADLASYIDPKIIPDV